MPSSPAFDAWSLREAAQALLLVAGSLETGLLQSLDQERSTEEAARRCALDPRAVDICLGALEELGVVERGARGWKLSPFGRARFLQPGARGYIATDLSLWRQNLRGWLFVEEVLRSGLPLAEDDSPDFLDRFYRSLDGKPVDRVRRTVERILARAAAPELHVLDVGGGSGVYAREFLARGCRVTLLDRPEVVAHVERAFGLAGREGLELVGGNFLEELPAGPYQVALLADVLHGLSSDDARRVLSRVAAVSEAGTLVAVVDRLRGRSSGAAFFAVTMLLYSAAGNTYGQGEVVEWLTECGFLEPQVEDVDPAHALITARFDPAGARRSG
jgi:SAM-dependent methyltransferase